MLVGDGASGVEFAVTGTDEVRRLDGGLVLTSIGYRGKPIRDLPFDESSRRGDERRRPCRRRRHGPAGARRYVAGWIKRGPTGFIGTNKSCSLQTVQALVADFNAGLLTDPRGRAGGAGKLVHRAPT